MTGIWVVVGVLSLTLAFGWYRKRSEGRIKAEPVRADETAINFGTELGTRASLVQFSSEFCAPCRTTQQQLLSDLTAELPGVRHIDLDVASHLELVERLGTSRTPTVLLLDNAGKIQQRMVGVPRRDAIHQAIDELQSESRVA